jgi:carbon-monoxide dehydrogenase large subunit
LWAARELGRPVKWVGDRGEAFACDTHGRDHVSRAEAAVDGDGRVLAVRVATTANMGAYLSLDAPMIPTDLYGPMVPGSYRIEAIHVAVEGVYTNTTPVDAYRGAGRPEATYLIERLMDVVAQDLGLGADEIRRRNFIGAKDMPYTTAGGKTYDCGDFARNMADAMDLAGWRDIEARRAEAAARGCLRGIGMTTYVEAAAGGGDEEAAIAFADDGTVTVLIGTQSAGQGHETAYAQIAAEGLGVPFETVRVVQGDTDRVRRGRGTGGSRSLPVGGAALGNAVAAVIETGKAFAAHLLQVADDTVEFGDGRFIARGQGDGGGLGILELAAAARIAENRPAGMEEGLDARARYEPQTPTFPNGCHVCEVEIDGDTGALRITGYVVVDDFGTIINPLLIAGQIHGGVVQGIGQAMMEQVAYDPRSGQLLSASFADYALPRADDLPPFGLTFNAVPTANNPLGAKGAGEAGAIAACAAVVNAAVDALEPFGVRHIDMPVTAEKIWRAMTAPPSNGDQS